MKWFLRAKSSSSFVILMKRVSFQGGLKTLIAAQFLFIKTNKATTPEWLTALRELNAEISWSNYTYMMNCVPTGAHQREYNVHAFVYANSLMDETPPATGI